MGSWLSKPAVDSKGPLRITKMDDEHRNTNIAAVTHSAPLPKEVDVVIVGGGPTGLFAGLLLHRLGISVCILDAKPRSLEFGRADALNARTQQYFTVANLLDDLLSQGLKCNTSSTFSEGEFKSRQSHWWTGLEHCLHKNFLMIGQPVVEDLLASKLPFGVVHHHQRVTGITEDEGSVEVTTIASSLPSSPSLAATSSSSPPSSAAATTTPQQTIRAKYTIAADGARSTIRSALHIPFTGTKPEMLWAVLDTFIETNFPRCDEIITFQVNGQSRVSWIPRERGLARFYVLLNNAGGEEVTLERAEESIRRHVEPYWVEFKRTEWFSTFDVKERIAETFISRNATGRVILAGDAAHVHSVNGGQGLNTGLADAFALSWRLAMVLRPPHMSASSSSSSSSSPNQKSKLADIVLQSYDLERRKTAQGVIDVAAVLVRDTIREAKQYVATIEKNAGYITGMGVAYDGIGSVVVEESEIGIWKAGKRCPDMAVRREKKGGEEEVRLYEIVSYGKYIVFFIGGEKRRLGGEWDDVVEQHHISKTGNKAVEGSDGLVADWIEDADDGLVVVVRPDMYIGFVGRDVASVEAHLKRLFTFTNHM